MRRAAVVVVVAVFGMLADLVGANRKLLEGLLHRVRRIELEGRRPGGDTADGDK